MSYRKKVEIQPPVANVNESDRESASKATEIRRADETTLDQVIRHVSSENYQRALDLFRKAGREPQLRNAMGVCLLRMQRYQDAIRVFREIVLNAGCTWMRADLPMVYKTNYATALLLGGHPSGCDEVLAEIHDESNASVKRLRAAIKKWVSSLSLWQKLNWRFGRLQPRNCQVTIDFVPGEFETAVPPNDGPNPKAPQPNSPAPNLRTAA